MENTNTPNNDREFRIRGSEKLLSIIHKLGTTERTIFGFFAIVLTMSAIALASYVNNMFLVAIPSHGGEIKEGIIGLPHSINPVLAFTDVDRDLDTLVYSGLMKYENGNLVPDIAESYKVSDDGLVYNFKLKRNVRFHDGIPLTAKDVEFTIKKIQDANIKSPKKAEWANINIKVVNEYEIEFSLKQVYTPFITNTTIGILPEHIWSNIDSNQFVFSQKNLEPIGSGPYKVSNIIKNKDGIPTSYELQAWQRYHGSEPYISKLSIFFFSNENEALNSYKNGVIESVAGISPKQANAIRAGVPEAKILHFPLPRIFGVFFNQNQSQVFTYPEVRQALNIAIDRQYIIKRVLYGYGIEIDSPLPQDSYTKSTSTDTGPSIDKAKDILAKAGWTLNKDGILEKKNGKTTVTLEFSISTADTPDLKETAEIIKSQWEELGAKVNVKIFEYGDLYQNVISTRKYDSLLFGEFIGKDLDLYAFWHSSQRGSSGLNIANYVNSKVDKLLEDARTSFDEKEKNKIYSQFNEVIQRDIPAVFIYSPEFMYVVPDKIQGINLKDITTISDRFYNIEKWYIQTEKVWKIFVKQN